MPIITPKVNLKDSFPYTNLDLEDNGPINVSNYNHQQQWTPSSGFTQDPQGQKQGGVLESNGFNGPEGLDLENNGPRNAPNYRHKQNFTPSDKFVDSTEGSVGKLENIGFDGPGKLDLENNSPMGAPQYGHQQNWTPTKEYTDNSLGQRQGGKLKSDGFDGPEELDLENNDPTNVAQYNHQQVYTPSSTYETYINEKGFEDSNLVQNSFNKKYNGRGYGGDFDIENNEPNRSNPLGAKSSNIIKSTRNGRTIQKQIQHQYTPKTPYK